MKQGKRIKEKKIRPEELKNKQESKVYNEKEVESNESWKGK
jgi:hypothetical protein